MATVLITGGTGMIGQTLTKELVRKGYDVVILTRNGSAASHQPVKNVSYAVWDIKQRYVDKKAIQQADFIIHLAGANVGAKRWTAKRKKEIKDSRIQSSGVLVKALKEIPNNVKAVVSASAIGWYGIDPQVPNPQPFVETDPPDSAFLGKTCVAWEQSLNDVAGLGKRLVKLRTGVVLSNEGGAYAEFKKPLKWGAATILGSGRQIVSWIHIQDIAGIYIHALENEKMEGVYNAVAPQPVNNKYLVLTMARTRNKFYMPVRVPEIALRVVLGEMSMEVLKSATVSSRKIQQAGYNFMFPSIEAAIKNLEAS